MGTTRTGSNPVRSGTSIHRLTLDINFKSRIMNKEKYICRVKKTIMYFVYFPRPHFFGQMHNLFEKKRELRIFYDSCKLTQF